MDIHFHNKENISRGRYFGVEETDGGTNTMCWSSMLEILCSGQDQGFGRRSTIRIGTWVGWGASGASESLGWRLGISYRFWTLRN